MSFLNKKNTAESRGRTVIMDTEIPSVIEFDHLYEITDQSNVSTYERSLIVNFYKLIRSLNQSSCDVHSYRSEEKTVALKDIVTGFLNASVDNFSKLHERHLTPAHFCDVTNSCVASLNNALEKFAGHFDLKHQLQLVKSERKNDWISPRIKSDWDIQYDFQKKKI